MFPCLYGTKFREKVINNIFVADNIIINLPHETDGSMTRKNFLIDPVGFLSYTLAPDSIMKHLSHLKTEELNV